MPISQYGHRSCRIDFPVSRNLEVTRRVGGLASATPNSRWYPNRQTRIGLIQIGVAAPTQRIFKSSEMDTAGVILIAPVPLPQILRAK